MGNQNKVAPVTNITNQTINNYNTGDGSINTMVQDMGYTGRWVRQFEREFQKRYGKAAEYLQKKHHGYLMPTTDYVIGVGCQKDILPD